MSEPRIKVPVLYPLGFVPGESEGWRNTVNECFDLAMIELHERVMDAGYMPHQGTVKGPGDTVEDVLVPTALGFAPNAGEEPRPRTPSPDDQAVAPGEPGVGEIVPIGMLRAEPGFGVFMPASDGKLAPCTTEEKQVYLIYRNGIDAWEKASQKDDAVVEKCWVVWDQNAQADRKKSGMDGA